MTSPDIFNETYATGFKLITGSRLQSIMTPLFATFPGLATIMKWVEQIADKIVDFDKDGRIVQTVILLLLIIGVRLILLSIINRSVDDVTRNYHYKRFLTYFLTSVALIGLAFIWLIHGGHVIKLAEFMGLIGAGLAVAMHDTVSNVSGWIFILWRKPFKVGERIEIDGMCGDVIDIRLLEFSMIEVGGHRLAGGGEQSTGRIIHIPNGMVLRKQVANFDTGFSHVWDEIPILLTFESDWEKAKDILNEIVNRHVEQFSRKAESGIRKAAQKYLIYAGKLTPIVYTSIEDSGVLLTMRFMVVPRQRRGVRQSIFEDILREFSRNPNIDFAYPTVRYFDNSHEGKRGGPGKAVQTGQLG